MNVFLVLIFFGSLNDISDGCNVGYYGKSCSDLCPDNCHDNECNATTGKCLSCVKGHYSNNTKDCVRCPDHCTACSSDKFCFACNSGFKGEVCENECANCRPNTSCDKNTGYCFENCSEGLSGELCNIPCDSKCKSCDRHDTGQCISCADYENGHACKEECFNKCLRNICNESYGSCSEECLSGYMTDKTCSRTCLSNCKDRCTFKCKELMPQSKTSSSTSKTIIGLIVGLVIGSIAVCIAVYIVVRRRKKKRSYCSYNSSERTQDQEKTSTIHDDDENIELLSSEVRRITETRELASADKLTVLEMQGTIFAIQQKYGYMKISVDKNSVTVEGDPLDIENAFNEINIKCGEVEYMRYKHSKSKEWLIFFQKEQIVEYINNKLKQKQLLGIWYINDTELTVFVHGKGNTENFKNALLESVSEIAEKVEKSLFSSEWRDELMLYIKRIFQDKVDIFPQDQHKMVIISTDDVAKSVTQIVSECLDGKTEDMYLSEPLLCKFVTKYWTQDDFDLIREGDVLIKTEANRIKLRGFPVNVDKCKDKLNLKLKDICRKQLVLKRTGVITVLEASVLSGTISDIENECRCVTMLPPAIDNSLSAMLSDKVVIDSQTLEEKPQDSSTNAPPIFQTRRHKIKTQLIQGDIDPQKADIIVVGSVENLDLQNGSSFSVSLKQVSPHPQTDYDRRYLNGIPNGEVAVIDLADFNKIYLTSLPPWKEASRNGGKVLRNFVRECLRLADKREKNFIAFSIMVTWEKLGYPMNVAVSIMYGAVVEFDSSYSNTSLKEISIGSNNEDFENIKTYLMRHFKTHERDTRDTRTNRIFIQDGTILTKPYDKSKYRMVKDGCAIDRINLQVEIGNLLDYTADVIVMGACATTEMKAHVLDENRVVIQESTGVKAKYVIHVMLQDTLAGCRSKLVECLEEASKKSINSVALPVLGSGVKPQTFSADGIGTCLFAAIDDFASKNPSSSVTDVRLVVPDSDAGCIPTIIAALQDRITAVNCQQGICKIFKSQLGLAESRFFTETLVTVYADAEINLDRCIKALDDRIGLEFAEKVVDVDMCVISSLEDKQIKNLIDSDVLVDIIFNKHAGRVTIFGPLLNVVAAETCLHNKMRQLKMKENNRQFAKELHDLIRWHWMDVNQIASEKWDPYDIMTNLYIETAYKAGSQTVELQSKDGKIYVIDFQQLVEYPKTNIYDTVMVIRKDILKKDFMKELQYEAKIKFSKAWTSMNENEVKRVEMEHGEEYKRVQKHFLAKFMKGCEENSSNVQVVKIEHIQNKTLYKQYKTKKYVMKQQKPDCKQTERRLWHETDEECIRWIINNGFNRSYCGVHEVVYGQGVYFAADASYSAQSFIAGNKPEAKKYMFLAKVLTGELIKGHPSMRVLPPVDPAKPTIVYDSAVDDVNNPTQFVIFHDKQAYPKYLITYTT